MIKEHNHQVLLFDWDGTIIDSNQYKFHDAWLLVFADEPKKQEKVLQVLAHPEDRMLFRYGIVARVIEDEPGNTDLQGVTNSDHWIKSDSRITRYTERFAACMKDHRRMPAFPNAKQTLETLAEQGYTMYVVSGSSEATIDEQIELYGLDYFVGRFGNSNTKHAHFQTITKREHKSDPSHYVVIGDGTTDASLASKIECHFIGVANAYNKWGDTEIDFPVIHDIGDLPNTLEDLS